MKNPKYLFMELLRILTSFYSFRELEKKIGVPMQTLWKYRTLRSMPERETAIKILTKIRESGILDEIRRVISDMASKDPYIVFNHIGVLEYISYDIGEIAREYRVNALIPLPDSFSIALAVLTASKTRIKLCLTDLRRSSPSSVCTAIVSREGEVIPLCIPSHCIEQKPRIMLIEAFYAKNSIAQVNRFLHRRSMKTDYVYVVYGNEEEIKQEINTLKDIAVSYKVLINTRY